MDFIADENIAKSVIGALRKEGFSVLSIRESFLGSPDEQIVKLAKKHKAIIITHDTDFGFLTHYPLVSVHPGIILIRLRSNNPKNVVENLMPFLKNTKLAKLRGRVTVVREGIIRIT